MAWNEYLSLSSTVFQAGWPTLLIVLYFLIKNAYRKQKDVDMALNEHDGRLVNIETKCDNHAKQEIRREYEGVTKKEFKEGMDDLRRDINHTIEGLEKRLREVIDLSNRAIRAEADISAAYKVNGKNEL